MPPRRDPLPRLRKICLALPEAREQIAWGEPTFRVRKKLFAMYANADNHHGRGRSAVWIKARAVNQHPLIVAHPGRFFAPPYVGPSGWVGVWLDRHVDWDELDGLLRAGYRLVAPKKLIAAIEAS